VQAEPPTTTPDTPMMHPLAQALVDAHATIAPKVAAASTAHVVGLLETFEADIGPMVAPIAQRLRDDPATPADLHPLLDALIAPPHFGVSLAISFALGAILSPVIGAAFAPAVQGIENAAWLANPSRPLSADLLAAAVLKGVEDEGTAASEAAKSGYSAGAFDVMVKAAGQAIGIQEALLLLRRAQISEGQFRQVEQYSNLNPAFYGMAELLKYGPLSVGEAVTAALKGHMSDADAATAVGYAGIDPSHFAVLKASAGRPLGLEEMLHLWNRGVMAQADVEAGIRQSDINDAYIPFALQLQHYFPPPRSVVPMLRSGAITEAQGRQLLGYYGVGEPWATAFVDEAKHTKSGAVKELTQAQVTATYEAQLMPRATALARIEGVGYSAADAGALLDLADEKRARALEDAAIRKVGTEYVARKITKAQATTALGAAQVPQTAVTLLFKFWDIELSTDLRHPTEAQITHAYRQGVLTAAECKTRLLALGIPAADLAIIVAAAYPPTKPNRPAIDAVVNA
jgi:ribosomal protein S13